MSAHRGVWNPVTRLWMFGNVDDCANALCELYHAMRASIAMLETLHEMNLDGTCVAAWNFDPTSDVLDVALSNTLRRDAFSRQGYTARRVFGIHPLQDREDRTSEYDELQSAAFDERARASFARNRRPGRRVA